MKLSAIMIGAAFVLSACGGATEPAPMPSAVVSDAAEAPPEVPVMGEEVPILAFGDSLFAGYGLRPGESYPTRLEVALRARGINARIANAGVSGSTSADGLARLAFTLDSQPRPPALVLLELGANDMLRALPPEQVRANLDAMLTELDRRHIRVLLMGMLAAPNLGSDYERKFNAIYPELAKQHDTPLVPFFLQAVLGDPSLHLQDHIHPTARGIELIVAATVGQVETAVKHVEKKPS